MATLAALRKQMAALEAKMAEATKAEMSGAIAKIQKIMADFGVTIAHLTQSEPKARAVAKKAPGKSATATAGAKIKGSKQPKYRDPSTGVTWSGVGRAPAWIASAKNRDDFLIAKPPAAETSPKAAAPAKKAAKRAASVKRASSAVAAKRAPRKVAATKKVAKSEAATKKPAAKKAAAKKAVSVKRAAVKKPSAKKATAKKAAAKKAAAKTAPAAAPAAEVASDAAAA